MTKTELIAARNAAGAAYAAAAATYVDAWITMKAFDMAGGNGHVAICSPASGFPGIVEAMPHSEFLRDVAPLHNRAVDRANETHVAIIATITD